MRCISTYEKSLNRSHAAFPHIFFIHPTFILIQSYSTLKPFKAGSQPTVAICAPHSVHRLKKGKVSRRIFLVYPEQPTHKRVGQGSAGTIWISFRTKFHYKEQLTR